MSSNNQGLFYMLEELPGLWDVLIGNMSFVGQRPEFERGTSGIAE